MKKNSKKTILFGASALLFSLASCQAAEVPSDTSSSVFNDSLQMTGHYIVQAGKSDYQIVISEKADDNVIFASNELQNFLYNATGARLDVIRDTSVSDFSGKYISLGETTLFNKSGLELPEELLKTGYILKTVDNQLYINARNGSGVYSAVYDYLSENIGLEIYSHDEVTFDKVDTIPLYRYDVEFKPLFDVRQILYKHLNSSTLYQRRMRLFTDLSLGKWAAFAHTTITKFLPFSKYGADHPEWYNDAHTQVCYSNPEVVKAMAEEMKSAIASNPEATYIQMGHEDNLDMCTCENCIKEREIYGNYAGQELEFTNKLQEILDPWLEKTYPGRSMKYVFFAYQTSQEPPAKYDTTKGKYVPVSDKFRINKNVMVMYCPIDADFSKKMSDPKNSAQYDQLRGWRDLFDGASRHGEMYIWTYSLSAKSCMIPMNNFGTYEEHYKFFSDCGATAILDQSFYETGTPSLEAFKIYTQSKLLYSTQYHYQELAEKFLNQYYGAASKAMTEYYKLLRSYYNYLDATKGIGAYVMTDLYKKEYWTFEILSKFFEKMEEGIEQIAYIKETDPSRYTTLLTRLRTEECFPIYMMFRFYMSELSLNTRKEYWNILSEYCKKFDIVSSLEGGMDVNNSIETWRSEIFGD